jgi:hypothetical protein
MSAGRDFWGPAFWKAIHCASASYRPDEYKKFKGFVESLSGVLPCDECREHLALNLKSYPMDNYLLSNHDMFFWSYILHDAVNKQVNLARGYDEDHPKYKKSPPYQDVKALYFGALSGEDCKSCGSY